MDVGCETALRAVRDGLIGGGFARALIVMPYLNCGTAVNTMSVVAKGEKAEGAIVRVSQTESIFCDRA